MTGALINAEQREAASNLTDIQRHATGSSGDAQGNPARIVIQRFRVVDARVLRDVRVSQRARGAAA